MKATIISIGDELLIGKTINSNATWLGNELTLLGIDVSEVLTIHDQKAAIIDGLNRALQKSKIVLITGGLGPTKDDITKKTLATFFGVELIYKEEILENIKNMFQHRNDELIKKNEDQAYVPSNCSIIKNERGTAPGMWFYENEQVIVSMPGVPHEMKSMMHSYVLEKLKSTFKMPMIVYTEVLTAGIPEAILSDRLNAYEESLPASVSLAYLPNLGQVKLRLTVKGAKKEVLHTELDLQKERLLEKIGKYVYGFDNDTQEGCIGKLLREKKATLSTAESCTGGLIAHRITSVPGSSDYFKGSIISYSNEIKEKILDVSIQTLIKHGAVSEETVTEMALGVVKKLNTDYGIAVSGIAGPGGGSKEKPVGLVWIAVCQKNGNVKAKKYNLTNNRMANIRISSVLALELLRGQLTGVIGETFKSG